MTRTAAAGLAPAVNMDTGYVHLLDDQTARRVLQRTHGRARRAARSSPARSTMRDAVARGASAAGRRSSCRRTAIGRRRARRLRARWPDAVDRFIGFELLAGVQPRRVASGTSTPTGPCWPSRSASAPSTRRCAATSSGSASGCATSVRPDFQVLTGNDLAIDMVMYGSDYLLGLSTFAPDLFAERDRCWAEGDPGVLRAQRRAPAPRQRRLPSAGPGLPARRRAVPAAARLDRQRRHAARVRRAARRGSGTCSRTSRRRLGLCDDPASSQVKRLSDRRYASASTWRRSASTCPSPIRPTVDALASADHGRRAHVPRTASPSCRWRAGTAPTTVGRPTSCAAAGRASAPAAPVSSGAARRSPCAPTAAPTRTSCASGRRRRDDLAELRALCSRPDQVAGLQLTHSGRWSVDVAAGTRRPAARRPAHRPGPDRRRARRAGRRLRRRRGARPAGRLRLRRREGLPRLPPPRAALRSRSAGPHGGDLAGRSRLLRTVARARAARPGMHVGGAGSAPSTSSPTDAGADGVGEPEIAGRPFGFSRAARAARPARRRPRLRHRRQPVLLARTCSGPRTSRRRDGYQPPEDPLVGVARLLAAAAELAARAAVDVTFVATGLTYLQEWVPARRVGRRRATRRCRLVGLGRMALSYPDLPADVLAGRAARRPAPVPHVQRLHDGAAQRSRVRVLAARRLLQATAPTGSCWPPRRSAPVAEHPVRGVAVVGLGIGTDARAGRCAA